jgi:DNA-binding MarR family transcriptional regulator
VSAAGAYRHERKYKYLTDIKIMLDRKHSTISTTITGLWKDRKLVDKKILPENQRITIVSLTAKGKRVLNEIKETQSEVYKTIAQSLNLTPEQDEYFKAFIENAISFFNNKLGFNMELIESV